MKTRQFPATSLGVCVATFVFLQLLSSGKGQPANPDEMRFTFPSPSPGTVLGDTNVTISWSGCCESGCPFLADNPEAANVLLFESDTAEEFQEMGISFTINCSRAAGGSGCFSGEILNRQNIGTGPFQLRMEMGEDFISSGTFRFSFNVAP